MPEGYYLAFEGGHFLTIVTWALGNLVAPTPSFKDPKCPLGFGLCTTSLLG